MSKPTKEEGSCDVTVTAWRSDHMMFFDTEEEARTWIEHDRNYETKD